MKKFKEKGRDNMNRKNIVYLASLLLLTMLMLSASLSVAAASPFCQSKYTVEEARAKISRPASKPAPSVTVNIRSPGQSENLLQTKTVNIIAEVTGTFSNVKYKIDSSGTEYLMTRWKTTSRYTASWTVTQSAGSHRVYVTAYGSTGKSVSSSYTTISIVTSYEAEIWYEIDYITGHAPTTAMLNYWVSYWDSRAIIAHPVLDDEITNTKYTQLTTSLFWEVEKLYNDDLSQAPGDDRAYGNVNNGNPFLQEKWMLWGAYWYQANIGGFCYVWASGNDGLAGNYIYINDGGLADWEASYGLTNAGGRIVALMHEAGHSIGVIKYSGRSEYYDPDYYSVMAIIRSTYNAAFTNLWYYSREYWATRNLGYY
jgi:hypothetical protein